jgi:RimJ/RimL family protein N-acetyltransferase
MNNFVESIKSLGTGDYKFEIVNKYDYPYVKDIYADYFTRIMVAPVTDFDFSTIMLKTKKFADSAKDRLGILKITSNGKVLGFAGFGKWEDKNNIAEWNVVLNLQVSGEGHGTKIGKLLTKALFKIKSQAIVDTIDIIKGYSLSYNTASQKLMNILGMSPDGTHDDITMVPKDNYCTLFTLKRNDPILRTGVHSDARLLSKVAEQSDLGSDQKNTPGYILKQLRIQYQGYDDYESSGNKEDFKIFKNSGIKDTYKEPICWLVALTINKGIENLYSYLALNNTGQYISNIDSVKYFVLFLHFSTGAAAINLNPYSIFLDYPKLTTFGCAAVNTITYYLSSSLFSSLINTHKNLVQNYNDSKVEDFKQQCIDDLIIQTSLIAIKAGLGYTIEQPILYPSFEQPFKTIGLCYNNGDFNFWISKFININQVVAFSIGTIGSVITITYAANNANFQTSAGCLSGIFLAPSS